MSMFDNCPYAQEYENLHRRMVQSQQHYDAAMNRVTAAGDAVRAAQRELDMARDAFAQQTQQRDAAAGAAQQLFLVEIALTTKMRGWVQGEIRKTLEGTE
jgi:hypothetical protein